MKKIGGFTLIELMLVFAIIAILATVTVSWVDDARARSRDRQVLRELQEVRTALQLYLGENGYYPNETAIITNPFVDNFNDMAQELVETGFLANVPRPPAGHTYQYYNYGPGNDAGALLITTLETYPASTGYSGSCRPFDPGEANWCTTASSNYFCLCNVF